MSERKEQPRANPLARLFQGGPCYRGEDLLLQFCMLEVVLPLAVLSVSLPAASLHGRRRRPRLWAAASWHSAVLIVPVLPLFVPAPLSVPVAAPVPLLPLPLREPLD